MDYETYVGFVHAHSERDGGHNDLGLPVDEGILVLNPFIFLQSRVVGHRIESLVTETRGQSLNAPPTLAVDDPFIGGMLLEIRDDLFETALLGSHFIVKVLTLEAAVVNCWFTQVVAGARCRRPLGGWRWQSGP